MAFKPDWMLLTVKCVNIRLQRQAGADQIFVDHRIHVGKRTLFPHHGNTTATTANNEDFILPVYRSDHSSD